MRGDGGHTVDGPAAPSPPPAARSAATGSADDNDMTRAPGAGAGPISVSVSRRVAVASSDGRRRGLSRAVTCPAVVPALGALSARGSREGSSGNAGGEQPMPGRGDGTGNPPNLDIRMSLTALSAPMAASICRGRTRLGGEVEPLPAASWRKTGDLTREFSIPEGVKFSDGEESTARPAVFSISRAAVSDSRNGRCRPAVKSAKALGPDTVEATASAPGRSAPRELAVLMMVPQKVLRLA